MTVVYSEEQIIAAVPGLDRTLLLRFVSARIIIPVDRPSEHATGFSPVDIARLRLACELCESFDFEDDALEVVMGLVDRLHSTLADFHALLEVVEDLPEDQRVSVARSLRSKLLNQAP